MYNKLQEHKQWVSEERRGLWRVKEPKLQAEKG